MDPGGGVGRARAAGDEGDPGLAGQLALGLGHHGGPALLAADDRLDLALMQAIKGRQIALARNAEDPFDPLNAQLVHQNLAAVAFSHPANPPTSSTIPLSWPVDSPWAGTVAIIAAPGATLGQSPRTAQKVSI